METVISFIIAGIILLAFVIAFFVFIAAGKKKLTAAHCHFIEKQWRTVTEESYRNMHTAILDADKLLGHVLELRGYKGSVGDQLKSAGPLFTALDSVWSAHKVRNRIAHEIGVKINKKQGQGVLRIYKKALNDLGATL
ncbi:hypothetical protein GF369_00010 [Candidatus Peregrinibacteria bacterium]|nr:hypothetical protein [Candidatus Peregrinibacteria bacterium]